MDNTFSTFAQSIFDQKYAQTKPDGSKETWDETAERVCANVVGVRNYGHRYHDDILKLMKERKFLPGGRYLYASGRPFHQVQNCLLLRAEDSREGWADLMQKVTMALMTGAGVGVDYSAVRPEGALISRTGGTSTGPLALMQMVNEAGRHIMQGGARRSALWAGLNWRHADIFKFIESKNWPDEVRKLKEKDFNFPAKLDGTNISVILDKTFFDAYEAGDDHAKAVYELTLRGMLSTAEPGFSVDYDNANESLRNACVTGSTQVLTSNGYTPIIDLIGKKTEVWNGESWSTVEPKKTGEGRRIWNVMLSDGRELDCTDNHKWLIKRGYHDPAVRVATEALSVGDKLAKSAYPLIEAGRRDVNAYTQGFVSGDGMDGYDILWLYEPKYMCAERLAVTLNKAEFTNINGIKRKIATFKNFTPREKVYVPFDLDVQGRCDWLAGLLDADGTELKEGGTQIASVEKGFLLNTQAMLTTLGVQSKITLARKAGKYKLPDGKGGEEYYDCQTSWRLLIGATQMQYLKSLGLKCERLALNKSPNRDASQFVKVVSVTPTERYEDVYCFNEPKLHQGCFNGIITGQCTEITSEDDSDICNLGSLNLARFDDLDTFREAVRLGTIFLLAGTAYSDVPYEKVKEVRSKNRRLGLGIMGVHEWLLKRGKAYGPDAELAEWLEVYRDVSTTTARQMAAEWMISIPLKMRAVAPTGTIGIIAETSTGLEPIFCVAYRRRYKGPDGHSTQYQYVIDPTAKRLIENGVKPELIEDAYTLAEQPERRIAFQAWVQQYVDHGISSTINLPEWGSELNNENTLPDFGRTLMRYLPKLRGITAYPDGCRGGQPLVRVNYETAVDKVGQVFVEQMDFCDITKGGSCGA